MLSKEEKLRILRTLEEDAEFRHAVAGLIGMREILEKLDRLWEEVRALREEQARTWKEIEKVWGEIEKLREEQAKTWKEIERLREEQTKTWKEIEKLREEQARTWKEIKKVWEEIEKLREEQTKIWEEIKELRKEQTKMWEEIKGLREGQTKIWQEIAELKEGQGKIWVTLNRLSKTVERLTLTVEEEAREVISYRMREEMGVRIALSSIVVDDKEINVYGVSDDLCVVGEATVRLGDELVKELERKVEYIAKARPDLLRSRMIKVIYADYATPSALRLAEEMGIWVLKWSGDLTPRVVHSLKQ